MIFPLIVLVVFLVMVMGMIIEIREERKFPKFFGPLVVFYGLIALFFLAV
jgi:hypothetical protein